MKLYRDITLRSRPGVRPTILANVDGIDNGKRNKAPNVAAHRYAMQWTGDTAATYEFLRRGVENAVFSGVHGVNPYISEDLGGHVGHTDREQFVRWIQFGSVSPMMRLHYTTGQPDREPWCYDEEVLACCRQYYCLRHALMPVFAAGMQLAFETGEPLLRRLDLEFSGSPEAGANDQFLLGDGLLFAPVIDGRIEKAVPPSWFKNLRSVYFDGESLTGKPLLERKEKQIDFDWGTGSPSPKVPEDHFSARFTGTIVNPTNQSRQLILRADDGVRLWLDGELVLDQWREQGATDFPIPGEIEPGEERELKLEYFERKGDAVCRLRLNLDPDEPVPPRHVWIPEGRWMDAWSKTWITGPAKLELRPSLSEMPMYVREGSVIATTDPSKPPRASFPTIWLDLFPSDNRGGEFVLMEDDGNSEKYRTGAVAKTKIHMSAVESGAIELHIEPTQGSFEGLADSRTIEVRVHAPAGTTLAPDLSRKMPLVQRTDDVIQVFEIRQESIRDAVIRKITL